LSGVERKNRRKRRDRKGKGCRKETGPLSRLIAAARVEYPVEVAGPAKGKKLDKEKKK